MKNLRTDTTFGNEYQTDENEINLDNLGNATGEAFNCIIYLFNFNNSSEYSLMTLGLQTLIVVEYLKADRVVAF